MRRPHGMRAPVLRSTAPMWRRRQSRSRPKSRSRVRWLGRIAAARDTHEWLVFEHDDEVIGYAYAHAFNPRAAYRWSTETSIYVAADRYRAGVGRKLYTQLLRRLTSAATDEPSLASPSQARPATLFIDPSVSNRLAYTGVSDGKTAAGTTSHGCSSICSAQTSTTARQLKSSNLWPQVNLLGADPVDAAGNLPEARRTPPSAGVEHRRHPSRPLAATSIGCPNTLDAPK